MDLIVPLRLVTTTLTPPHRTIRNLAKALLAEIEQAPETSETLTTMLATSRKVTASYWPGLFHCYDVADLPRTNNDLEQYFGSARYHERRATGRKTASPGVVVRGAVRVVAGVATRLHHFRGADLQPGDIKRWYTLRDELDMRQQARRAQFRFRRNPSAYLADLEHKLLLLRLPLYTNAFSSPRTLTSLWYAGSSSSILLTYKHNRISSRKKEQMLSIYSSVKRESLN